MITYTTEQIYDFLDEVASKEDVEFILEVANNCAEEVKQHLRNTLQIYRELFDK